MMAAEITLSTRLVTITDLSGNLYRSLGHKPSVQSNGEQMKALGLDGEWEVLCGDVASHGTEVNGYRELLAGAASARVFELKCDKVTRSGIACENDEGKWHADGSRQGLVAAVVQRVDRPINGECLRCGVLVDTSTECCHNNEGATIHCGSMVREPMPTQDVRKAKTCR